MKKLIYLFFITVFLTGCVEDTSVSERQTNIKNIWKVVKVTESSSSSPVYQNPLPSGQSIREDYSSYRFQFKEGGTYSQTLQDGTVKSGVWELSNDDQSVILDKGTPQSVTYEILGLTQTALTLRFTESSNKTGNRTLTIDFIPA
jgi:outer membrane biogenesis lipoprotein LolB